MTDVRTKNETEKYTRYVDLIQHTTSEIGERTPGKPNSSHVLGTSRMNLQTGGALIHILVHLESSGALNHMGFGPKGTTVPLPQCYSYVVAISTFDLASLKAGTEHAGFSPGQARNQSSTAEGRGVCGGEESYLFIA